MKIDIKNIVSRLLLYLAVMIVLPEAFVAAQDLQSAIKLTRSEQYRKADLVYRSVLQKNPDDGSAYFYYGENYLQKYFSDTLTYSYQEMADSASRLFRTGIELAPVNPLNYVGLGEIELIDKKVLEARSYFEKALSLLPSKTNRTATLSKKEQAVVYIKMANAYLKAQATDTVEVFPLLRKAEQLDNKNFDLYIAKGDACLQLQNDGSTALRFYNRAQDLNPHSPRVKLRLGQLWLSARNYASALTYFMEAVNIDSNYAPAYREMGYLYLKTRKADKAKENYAKFLSLSAGSRMARIQYINNLFELQDYAEAIIQLNIVISLDSSKYDINRALGYAYYETGQYEKGLYYMIKFFDNAPSDKIRISDYVYYGKLLSKNDKDSLSAEVLMKAFEMDTTQTDILNQAISSCLKIKDYGKAAEIVMKKMMIKKDVANDYYILGKVYYGLQEWHKADSAFSINVSLDPDNIKGHLWKAYSLVNLDSDSKEGLAKPAFEMLIDKVRSDTVRYANELKVAYSYLSYYYFVQYNKTKNRNDGITSKTYCEKVLAIDPADENAGAIFKDLKTRLK